MRLALYQPDIAQNAGTLLRLGACLGVSVDIIEPCGFVLDDKHFRRAGMDYLDIVNMTRYASWDDFYAKRRGRLILLSTKASVPYTEFKFFEDDSLLLGRESAGVPDDVHYSSDARVLIPMKNNTRSLNVAIAGAIVLSEAIRQLEA